MTLPASAVEAIATLGWAWYQTGEGSVVGELPPLTPEEKGTVEDPTMVLFELVLVEVSRRA
jgi:hypothetical protein